MSLDPSEVAELVSGPGLARSWQGGSNLTKFLRFVTMRDEGSDEEKIDITQFSQDSH